MNGSCTNVGHETRYSTDGSSLEFERCVGPRGELWAMQEPPSAERKHKPLPDSHGLFFFFCQTPLLLPELFRNRGALRPVLWMQRFVCILPSNKSGPVLFLMKSRSGGFVARADKHQRTYRSSALSPIAASCVCPGKLALIQDLSHNSLRNAHWGSVSARTPLCRLQMHLNRRLLASSPGMGKPFDRVGHNGD